MDSEWALFHMQRALWDPVDPTRLGSLEEPLHLRVNGEVYRFADAADLARFHALVFGLTQQLAAGHFRAAQLQARRAEIAVIVEIANDLTGDHQLGFGHRADGQLLFQVLSQRAGAGQGLAQRRALVVGTSPDGDHQRVHCAFSTPPVPVQEAIAEFLASASAAQ